MKTTVKILIAIASILIIESAQADRYSSSSISSGSELHVISGLLGFMGPGMNTIVDNVNGQDTANRMILSGLYGLGADYEYMAKPDFSVGGFFRYYSTSDTVGRNNDVSETAFLLGGLVHAYLLKTETWSGYIGTGLTTIKLTHKDAAGSWSPDMGFGFPIVFGVGYKINDKMTGGIEHMQVMAIGEKVNGWPVSDYMFRLRYAL